MNDAQNKLKESNIIYFVLFWFVVFVTGKYDDEYGIYSKYDTRVDEYYI